MFSFAIRFFVEERGVKFEEVVDVTLKTISLVFFFAHSRLLEAQMRRLIVLIPDLGGTLHVF